MNPNYLGVIPARGGSKRIPRKNLVAFAGKPLLAHTIEAALSAARLHRVVVSTEDREIAAVAEEYHAEVPFLRPLSLAQDRSTIIAVINNVLDYLEQEGAKFDAVVLLQPTAPFRTGQHIDAAVSLFEKTSADTVTAVYPAEEHPYYAWTISKGELTPFFSTDHQALDRHRLPPAYFENGSIYVIRRDVLESGKIYGPKIIPFPMSRRDSVDIDTRLDLHWAEFLQQYHPQSES